MTNNAYPFYENAVRDTHVKYGDGSMAEATLYDRLRQQLPEDWMFVWGYRIGVESEYDFLIIAPGHGVVYMECKGGGYHYVGGRVGFEWENRMTGKREPRNLLAKAAVVKNGYLDHLRKHLFPPKYHWGVMGACVVFPNHEHVGCNWNGQPLYRESDTLENGRGLKQIVIDSIEEGMRVLRKNNVSNFVRLSKDDAQKIWQFMTRPGVEIKIPPPGKLDLSTYREYMKSYLTLAQGQVLQRILNPACQRLLVTGGAGTGKTLIAQAAATQFDGRVLYVCYNKVLANEVRLKMPDKSGLTVSHLHGLSVELLGHTIDIEHVPNESQNEFWKRLDAKFLEQVRALEPGSYDYYDLILVDEAQDMSHDQLRILQRFCDTNKGKMVFFFDHGQTLYAKRMTDDELKKSVRGLEEWRLTVNMRNPKPVVRYCNEHTANSGDNIPVVLDGPSVIRKRMKLADVDQYLSDEILPRYELSDIAVISPSKMALQAVGLKTAVSFYGPEGRDADKTTIEITKNLAAWRANKCAWKSTTHSFKGMEAMAVVHIVPANQHFDNLLYVGGSRATYQLFVIELEGE